MSRIADIAIVGGGVIGLSIARQLAQHGRRVTVIERGVCGAEASWAGAGIVTSQSPHRADALARFQARSVALYPAFCAALCEESGVDPEYDRCGELQLAFDEHACSILHADDRLAHEGPILDADDETAYRFHASDSLRNVEPVVGPDAVGGLECTLAGQVRNPRLLRALRIACQRAGVEIREHTPVVDFVVDASRVVGVETETDRVLCGSVVLCAGAWSSSIGQRLREIMPMIPVRGQIILLKFENPPFRRIISYGSSYLVPRRDGHVLLGATDEPDAGFVKRTTPAGIAQLTAVGLRLVPTIAGASVEATWAGLRPGTSDERPYIGPVPGFDGLIAATGHLRNGITLAPATAESVAAILNERPYDINLSMCAPGRA